jgi:hypothetical protein
VRGLFECPVAPQFYLLVTTERCTFVARSTVLRRNVKMKLAIAFAVLMLATLARADSINTPTGILIIPDGSTVTSFGVAPYDTPLLEEIYGTPYFVDYSFADGTGETDGNALFNYGGTINFTVPVSSVTFSWVQGIIGDFGPTNPDGSSGVTTLTGSISQINWYAGDLLGGITSMSYTVPEPSSLLLSGMGLAALIGLARRNRTKGRKASVSVPA